LTLIACGVLSVLLYGFGLPPFRKSVAVESRQPGKASPTLAVEVGQVERGSIEEKITAVGSLMALRSVNVAAKISGRVERVHVQVGDQVKDGQLIAQLDARLLEEELQVAQAAVKVAEATLKGKQAELADLAKKLERARRLFEKSFVSRQEVDTLDSERNAAAAQQELARAQIAQMKARLASAKLHLSETQLKAPFPGYVETRLVDPGAMVSAGMPIAALVDIKRVKVIIAVVEKQYPKIFPGQKAIVTLDAFGDRHFQGKVVRLAPVLSQETRTGELEVEVDNPGAQLKPGMFARVEILVNQRHDVLLVPEGALVKTASGHAVFRLESGGADRAKVQSVAVEPGASRNGRIEIRGALKVGDRVVTLGVNLLKDGQSVQIGAGSPKGKRRES
jgi:HlyD family secretion protein